ncbi:MAG TPA: zinc ribbon domain-containing protein [Solirubrobacterales bacterium]
MPVVGLFGISNDGLNLAVNLLVVLLVVVYLALIVWTFLDARRRIEDSWLVACATAAALFPFVGAMVYSILRPPEFIEDRKERELEIRASQLRVKQLGEQSCPNCEYPVERNYLRCPNCEARLKDPCPTCQKPIDPRWAMCPYCETPVRSRQPARRSSGRRRARPERPDREPPSRDAQRAARAGREQREGRGEAEAPPRRAATRRAKPAAPKAERPAPAPKAERPAPAAKPATPPKAPPDPEQAPVRSRSSRAPDAGGEG